MRNRAIVLDAVHVAVEPVAQEGVAFGRLEEDVLSGAMTYYALTAVSYPFLALYFAGASVFHS